MKITDDVEKTMEQENKKTILVVEDEEKLRKTVADFLALYE